MYCAFAVDRSIFYAYIYCFVAAKTHACTMGRINYAEHVPAPDGESIGRMKNLFSVVFNVRDAMDYGKSALLNGKDCRGKNLVLGDRFFVQSGFCDNETSEPACRNKPRYLFVDNVPSNVPPCMDTSKNQAVHSRCRENEKFRHDTWTLAGHCAN